MIHRTCFAIAVTALVLLGGGMLMSFDTSDAAGVGTFENPYSGTVTGSGDYDGTFFIVGSTIDIRFHEEPSGMSYYVSEGFGLSVVKTSDEDGEHFYYNLKGTISAPGTIYVADDFLFGLPSSTMLTIYAIESPGQPVDLGTYTGGDNVSNQYFVYSGFDVYAGYIANPSYMDYNPHFNNPFYIRAGSTIEIYDAAFTTLPDGFSGEYVEDSAAGGWVYKDVSRRVVNGDGSFDVRVRDVSWAARTITFNVVDLPYDILDFVSDPIENGRVEYVA